MSIYLIFLIVLFFVQSFLESKYSNEDVEEINNNVSNYGINNDYILELNDSVKKCLDILRDETVNNINIETNIKCKVNNDILNSLLKIIYDLKGKGIANNSLSNLSKDLNILENRIIDIVDQKFRENDSTISKINENVKYILKLLEKTDIATPVDNSDLFEDKIDENFTDDEEAIYQDEENNIDNEVNFKDDKDSEITNDDAEIEDNEGDVDFDNDEDGEINFNLNTEEENIFSDKIKNIRSKLKIIKNNFILLNEKKDSLNEKIEEKNGREVNNDEVSGEDVNGVELDDFDSTEESDVNEEENNIQDFNESKPASIFGNITAEEVASPKLEKNSEDFTEENTAEIDFGTAPDIVDIEIPNDDELEKTSDDFNLNGGNREETLSVVNDFDKEVLENDTGYNKKGNITVEDFLNESEPVKKKCKKSIKTEEIKQKVSELKEKLKVKEDEDFE